jgi:hypothetical protein
MKNLLFIALLFSFSLTSCGCCKELKNYQTITQTEVSDSIVVKEIVRYDTVRIPAEQVQIFVPVYKLVNGYDTTIRIGRASASLKVKNNKLNVSSNCDQYEKIIASKDKEIERYKNSKSTIKIPIPPKREVSNSKFAVFCIWYSIFLTAIIILFIYFKIKANATRG